MELGCQTASPWKFRELYYKDAEIDLPSALRDSKEPTPPKNHPIFSEGHAYHLSFDGIDTRIMDAKLRKSGLLSSTAAASQFLNGFTKEQGFRISRTQSFKSPVSKGDIQLLSRIEGKGKSLALLVHCITRNNRQIICRTIWDAKDKSALDIAYRISNSLRWK